MTIYTLVYMYIYTNKLYPYVNINIMIVYKTLNICDKSYILKRFLLISICFYF